MHAGDRIQHGFVHVDIDNLRTVFNLLTRHGNRVGAVLYHPGAEPPETVLPPGLGRLQVLQLLARIRQPRPSASS